MTGGGSRFTSTPKPKPSYTTRFLFTVSTAANYSPTISKPQSSPPSGQYPSIPSGFPHSQTLKKRDMSCSASFHSPSSISIDRNLYGLLPSPMAVANQDIGRGGFISA